ncbi:heavy metal translocating P-type ATPase [Planctomicrobium sp. SH527]|uniref:heavy metal translocating P-type ATPase n=1 Tax=Planctomicrobium sp. SH527 TaxID=3448123 RepID=UPI003F5B001D
MSTVTLDADSSHWIFRFIGQCRKQPEGLIAGLAVSGIAVHLGLKYGTDVSALASTIPLYFVLSVGGIPLVLGLLWKVLRGEFGSDLLAGVSIVTSVLLGEYLAGSIVVLMLSGGQTLENFATEKASSALQALARRMPSIAHRLSAGKLADIALDEIQIGDSLVVFPHETCPVDGTVLEGHGTMDESYLTGEPFLISKVPGAAVLSGAINGEQALTISADKRPVDSRYAKIMEVMRLSQQQRSRLRRLGDSLGAIYTPVALVIGIAAWIISGDPLRFLAVLVVATPCPLLIAIPVAIVGTISQAATRGIVVKDPAALELIDTCEVAIFDKTGTLTYGKPKLVFQWSSEGIDSRHALQLAASLERYSKHPLSSAILDAAQHQNIELIEADRVGEKPGTGLSGEVAGQHLWVTSRSKLLKLHPEFQGALPPQSPGLECLMLIDSRILVLFQFRDEPRKEGGEFIRHLPEQHGFRRILLVSGDREAEVRFFAEQVGIQEVYAGQSPEEKLRIVQEETRKASTIYLGDGINDAPAMTAATIGIAFGQSTEVAAEAARVVIMDSSLERLDEFLHLGRRMRTIALQSAVGGMLLSLVGMGIASIGMLPPVAGAIFQEVIDVVAVLNALRTAFPQRSSSDFEEMNAN